MRNFLILISGISLSLLGCNFIALAAPDLITAIAPLPTSTKMAPPLGNAPVPPTPFLAATVTDNSTLTPIPSPTATRVVQGPGEVVVPILLYHHVGNSSTNSRYYVSPEKFEAQIKLLHDWEYTSISTAMLVEAISAGAELPARPIIITFDDGNLDNYTTAFPIMQKYGFTGVLYIVGKYVGADLFMSARQIKEMAAAGWEVGSHSMKHLDLQTLEPKEQRREIVESRQFLEDVLGLPIQTFAYPFGNMKGSTADYVRFAGYIAAMGTDGTSAHQNEYYLFNLRRAEIKGSEGINAFIRFLPWQGDPVYLTIDDPTPSATP